MADPLSITAGVLALIQVSVHVSVLLRQFRNDVGAVNATLTGLLNDVAGFQQVLESMKETFDQDDIKSNLQATGHVGSHWKNLARSLDDGASTLQQLHTLLDNVNKTTSILDAPRKQLRFKSAMEQIATYREQIQSYRAALHLSLSTIILWNQVTFQKSAEKIPERITPTLDKLYDEFRTFGALLNAKIEKLQNALPNQNDQDEHELKSMNNLRECVRSAAEVASTASTTLNAETSDRMSVKHGSDFGDVFVKDANEPMLRWMSSNTVYEFEDMEAPFLDPSEASTGEAPTEYQSDSDSDIENEMIRSLFNEGKKRKEQNDLMGAIRHFRNCWTRFSSNASYTSLTSLQSVSTCGVSKTELLQHLVDSYSLLGSWDKAKSAMIDKLSITERQVGKKDELYLWDTMKLAEIMMKNQEYVEAQLQGRKSLRGFKKLGEAGYDGYERCLTLLIQLCSDEGKVDEEEAYAALLGSHEKRRQRTKLNGASKSFDRGLEARSNAQTVTSAPLAANTSDHTEYTRNINDESGTPIQAEGVDTPLSEPRSPPLPMGEHSNDSNPQAVELPESTAGTTRSDAVDIEQNIPASPDDAPSPLSQTTTVPMKSQATTITGDSISFFKRIGPVSIPMSSSDNNPVKPTGHTVCTFYEALTETSAKKYKRSQSRDIDFFERYCQEFQGNKPHYLTEPMGLNHYACMVKINSIQGCKVFGYATEQQAKEAAIARACELYISAADEEHLLRGTKLRDPSSDKEVCYPEIDRLEYKEVVPEDPILSHAFRTPERTSVTPVAEVPHITVTSDDTEFAAYLQNTEASSSLFELPVHDPSIRRSVSDSNIDRSKTPGHGWASMWSAHSQVEAARNTALGRGFAKNMTSSPPEIETKNVNTHKRGAVSFSGIPSNGTVPEWVSGDDHFMSRKIFCAYCDEDISLLPQDLADRHMRRSCLQAWAVNDSLKSEDAPTCPICNSSLSGLSEDAVSVHVNGCLDATRTSTDTLQGVEDMSDPRVADSTTTDISTSPQDTVLDGTWACNFCKSESLQLLSEDTCDSCDRRRDRGGPNSANGFKRQPFDHYRTILTSLDLDDTNPRRKIVLLGDAWCGKTFLASAWSQNKEPTPVEAQQPIANDFIRTTVVSGRQIELSICDLSGNESYSRLRPLSYRDVHVVLICFDISEPNSFENISELWNIEAEHFLGDVPKILVGCKKDLRNDKAILEELRKQNLMPISPYAGDKLAIKMQALAYFETSAVKQEGLAELFDYVAEASLKTPSSPKLTRLRRFLSRSEIKFRP